MLGGTFEYLMSTLPYLSLQNTEEAKERILGLLNKYGKESKGRDEIVKILDDEAAKFLTGKSLALFEDLNLNNIHEDVFRKSEIQLVSTFAETSYKLKKDLRELRMSTNTNEEGHEAGKVAAIIGQGSPLQKEINIIKYQWARIEEYSSGHFANFEALITYKIKLLLLLRWWSFNASEGLQKFNELTTSQ